MRYGLIVFAVCALICAPLLVRADEISDISIRKAEAHVRANPTPIKRAETPADVVRIWQEMTVVADLIGVAHHGRLADGLKAEAARRIGAATSSTVKVGGWDDSRVQLLADAVALYAKTAAAFQRGETSWGAYNLTRSFITDSAAGLAREVEATYAKPGSIIPAEAPVEKW